MAGELAGENADQVRDYIPEMSFAWRRSNVEASLALIVAWAGVKGVESLYAWNVTAQRFRVTFCIVRFHMFPRHFLPDQKMTWVKIVELVRPYPTPFTAFL